MKSPAGWASLDVSLGTVLLQPDQFSDGLREEVERVLRTRALRQLKKNGFIRKLKLGRRIRKKAKGST